MQFKTSHSRRAPAVKDVDRTRRTVTGYFSAFGNQDSDGDVIRRGAYADTIERRGPEGANRIWHLDQHDPRRRLSKPNVLREDRRGLYFESKLPDTALANDVLVLYQEGLISEHSVGIDVRSRDDSDRRVITDVALWEGSTVTWGANADTPTVEVKARLRSALKEGLTDPTAAAAESTLEAKADLLGHLNRKLRNFAHNL